MSDLNSEMDGLMKEGTPTNMGIAGVPPEHQAAFTVFSDTVYKNLVLFFENRLRSLEARFKEWDLAKFNVATLSTLMVHKGLVTREEFKDCFNQMEQSFGPVNMDGTMEGKVIITKYNFPSERQGA